jgi:drug/metabolite transporter (DMT)-like permease
VKSTAISPRVWIVLALATVYIIWGTTYLGIRYALESFPPYLMMGIRFVLAGGALFIFLRARGTPMPTLKQWRSAALIGVLLLVVGMGSVAVAEQQVSSGLAATLVAVMPLWALLFSVLWRNFPTRTDWIGVALGVVGVAILSLEGNLQANPVGVGLMLFATAGWALGSVWMTHLDMPRGAMGNAAEMLAGGAMLLIIGALRGEQVVGAPTTGAVLALAYLITFGSLATLTAYSFLLKTVSPALATSYSFVNPVIALLLGVVLAGETLTGSALIALPVILVGVAFVLRGKTRR